MQHEPELLAETRAWLERAQKDLAAAAHEFTAEPPLVEDIVFHAQQAAEKALKAFLTWHQQPFRKTHSIEELGEQCLQIDSSLKAVIDRAVPLTEYAWQFRYPGEPETPTKEESESAVKIGKEVFFEILSRLPKELNV
jgi:HEPN domain-containing protein